MEDEAGVKRRHGKPRVRWVGTGLDKLWHRIGTNMSPDLSYSIMNLNNEEHIEAIVRAAQSDLAEKAPSH
eukprot:1243803-Karenia_brevis.AAC.1